MRVQVSVRVSRWRGIVLKSVRKREERKQKTKQKEKSAQQTIAARAMLATASVRS
jgi:hypothetical protein